MVRRRAVQASVLLFALSVGGTARGTASLAWTASERPCISEEELREAVSARLGRDPFVPLGQGEISIEGRELPATAGQLRARVVQRDREGNVLGTRDLEATSCEELRRSVAFVVFLIVDPDAALGGPVVTPTHPPDEDESSATEEEPSAANERPPVADEGAASSRSAPRSDESERAGSARPPPLSGLGADLGLWMIVSNGLLAKPDVGPALALGVDLPTLPIRLEWRATYRIAAGRGERYDFRAVEQQWRACYFRRVVGATLGMACGGVTWTAILPEARGLAGGDQAPKTLFSPTLAVGPAFEVGATRLFVDLSLAMPWPRYAFTYGHEGRAMPLHEVSPVVWSVGIGAATSLL